MTEVTYLLARVLEDCLYHCAQVVLLVNDWYVATVSITVPL